MKASILIPLLSALCFAQPAVVAPASAAKVLKMLTGDWRVGGTAVEYGAFAITHDESDPLLAGRIKTSKDNSDRHWRRFFVLSADGPDVVADFTDAKGKVTHYVLREATDYVLRFEAEPSDGNPVRRLTYERVPRSGAVDYTFQTGDRTTDQGRMEPGALIRPLSE